LRAGLEARAASTAARGAGSSSAGAEHDPAEPDPAGGPDPAELDDWYLRRGRYAHGAVHDLAWQMELDTATTWLDGLPLRSEIVELAAGTGWWSALLATKGELHAYDASGRLLDRARDRLLAHRLRAHLHVRDAWAAPDRTVDTLFAGFPLGHVARPRLEAFVALARSWLKPGGRLALIDPLPDPASGAVDETPVHRAPDEVAEALAAAEFVEVEVRKTGRYFLRDQAVAP